MANHPEKLCDTEIEELFEKMLVSQAIIYKETGGRGGEGLPQGYGQRKCQSNYSCLCMLSSNYRLEEASTILLQET